MQSHRGFSLLELLVVMAMIMTIAAMAVPAIQESSVRNTVWTATEMIGVQVRQARLKAITKNATFRIRFDCPAVGQVRVLQVVGDPIVDDAADRCTTFVDPDGDGRSHDSGVMQMPVNATYTEDLPILEVNGRGTYSVVGVGALPITINVGYQGRTFRSMTISRTGQISFATY